MAAIALERTALSEWPARIPVKIGALQSQATLVLIAPRPDDGLRSWTRAPAQVDVALVSELPETPEPETLGGIFAMVELPASGEGSIEIGGVTMTAHWLPAPKRVRGHYALPLLWREHVIGWANVSVTQGDMHVALGYVRGAPPSEEAFNQALEAELANMRAFLGLLT